MIDFANSSGSIVEGKSRKHGRQYWPSEHYISSPHHLCDFLGCGSIWRPFGQEVHAYIGSGVSSVGINVSLTQFSSEQIKH